MRPSLVRAKKMTLHFLEPLEPTIWNYIYSTARLQIIRRNQLGFLIEKSMLIQNFDKICGSNILQIHHRRKAILLSDNVETAFLHHRLHKPFYSSYYSYELL